MARPKWAVLAAILGAIVAGTGFAVRGVLPARHVTQPINFPHDVHAGTYQVPCMYCHSSADRSPAAGIPSVQVCAGCHIPGGMPLIAADRPEIQKLIGYWERQEPIPWERIHNLPDHVRFTHMMHINAGVQCSQCHGPVETMAEIRQVSSLQMGWCIDCHRQRGARTDCSVCHY
jgi:hypothetical protein